MAEIQNTNAVIKITSADPTTKIKVNAPSATKTLKIGAVNAPAIVQVASSGVTGTLRISSVIVSDLQIDVGTTTTLPAGSQATVTNSGTNKHAVLNFGIPKGEKGDKGDKGDPGSEVAWGAITGNIADQTDLASNLAGKQAKLSSSASIEVGADNTLRTKTVVHEQGVASNSWSITHNLNKFPAVTVIDSAGNEVSCQVTYTDENSCVINMNASFKGKAYLN